MRFPLFFRRHEFRPDSGGDGRLRGGPGAELEMAVEVAEPAVANTAGDGVRHGACGMRGGEDGQPHRYVLRSAGRPDRPLRTKEVGIPIRPGDVLDVRSGGGGGYGPPERAQRRRSRARCAPGLRHRAGRLMLRIGIDVGGTFTDLVAVGEEGSVTLAKAASTPADPSLGVMEGLERLAEALGMDRRAMLGQTARIVHGTTVATNALLERKGAKVGLLTTEGHRDVLEMREGLKDDRYDLRQPPPEPLVPRELRLAVRERMRADGRIETPLDQRSLDDAIAALREAGSARSRSATCTPGATAGTSG